MPKQTHGVTAFPVGSPIIERGGQIVSARIQRIVGHPFDLFDREQRGHVDLGALTDEAL